MVTHLNLRLPAVFLNLKMLPFVFHPLHELLETLFTTDVFGQKSPQTPSF
jgi:hypothetical protein